MQSTFKKSAAYALMTTLTLMNSFGILAKPGFSDELVDKGQKVCLEEAQANETVASVDYSAELSDRDEYVYKIRTSGRLKRCHFYTNTWNRHTNKWKVSLTKD